MILRTVHIFVFSFTFAYSTLALAEQIYKWTDNKGNVHYSTSASDSEALPAKLPELIKEESTYKKQKLPETCSKHGGINCAAGADVDGSVICLDGYKNADNRFNFSCTEARLEIVDVQAKNSTNEYSVFIRNQSGVEAKSPVLVFMFSAREKREIPGPEVVAPYESEEIILKTSTNEVLPSAANLLISCANCP